MGVHVLFKEYSVLFGKFVEKNPVNNYMCVDAGQHEPPKFKLKWKCQNLDYSTALCVIYETVVLNRVDTVCKPNYLVSSKELYTVNIYPKAHFTIWPINGTRLQVIDIIQSSNGLLCYLTTHIIIENKKCTFCVFSINIWCVIMRWSLIIALQTNHIPHFVFSSFYEIC